MSSPAVSVSKEPSWTKLNNLKDLYAHGFITTPSKVTVNQRGYQICSIGQSLVRSARSLASSTSQ